MVGGYFGIFIMPKVYLMSQYQNPLDLIEPQYDRFDDQENIPPQLTLNTKSSSGDTEWLPDKGANDDEM